MPKIFPPEFLALMEQYAAMSADLGDDHPLARRLWLIVVTTAPDWFQAEMHQMAQHIGLIPEPVACDNNGNKFYALDALAEKLGLSLDQVKAHMAEMRADAVAAGLPASVITQDASKLHRMH